jgi:hypothetical protein
MKARARSTRIRLDLGVCDKRQSQGQSNQIRQPAALVVWSTGAVTGARDVWDAFVVPYTRDVWSFEKLWVCTASIFPLKGAIPTILEKTPSLPSDSLLYHFRKGAISTILSDSDSGNTLWPDSTRS